jgi:hypothetical protein
VRLGSKTFNRQLFSNCHPNTYGNGKHDYKQPNIASGTRDSFDRPFEPFVRTQWTGYPDGVRMQLIHHIPLHAIPSMRSEGAGRSEEKDVRQPTSATPVPGVLTYHCGAERRKKETKNLTEK